MGIPSIGDKVYVPTIDKQPGGLAKVIMIVEISKNLHQILIEKCGSYTWEGGLAEIQAQLKSEFGDNEAVR